MNKQTIKLKKNFALENGGHILYLYESKSSYVDNLVAYVLDGIRLQHATLIIGEGKIYAEVRARLQSLVSFEESQHVYFEDNRTFYGIHTDFHADRIFDHFDDVIKSLPIGSRTVRTWARVVWKGQDDLDRIIDDYERASDASVKLQQLISVCAYDGKQITADLLTRMLRTHDYFMTDTELVKSPLYTKKESVFPSLSVQSKIESEMDFYKSKLDFVHVVSHEVRNPLTIINGYANLLRNTESHLSADGLAKLVAIEQYVKAINHELSHIIETEQMLSNELYMKLESISPYDTIHEVIELMTVKSSVENVAFEWSLWLGSNERMLGNALGLRLILSNLVSNAIKYAGENGRVRFSAKVHEKRIRFDIKDNGIGMSNQQLNSLFTKYGKFNENKSGQGIGLYVVKNLTDRFNGHVQFTSQPGQGTEVTVDFPLLDVSTDDAGV